MTERYIKDSVCDEIAEWLCSCDEPSATFRGGIRVTVRDADFTPDSIFPTIEFALLRDSAYGRFYEPQLVTTINPYGWSFGKARCIVNDFLKRIDAACDARGLWELLPIAEEDL